MKESRDKFTLNLPNGKKDEYKEYALSKEMSMVDADMQKNADKQFFFSI